MDGIRDYHTKWTKSERDKYHMMSPVRGNENMAQINENMAQINLPMKQNHAKETKLVISQVERAGGGVEWEVGVSKCKLLYTEWINNKVRLYSTGNYIQ